MKKIIIIILCFTVIAGFVSIPETTNADTLSDLQSRANELNNQIINTQNQISSLQKQAKDTESLIASLDSQNKEMQKLINLQNNKISITSDQINQTQAEIAKRQSELANQKENLFETMRVYYESSNQTTLEALMGANSLSDGIDKAKYLESIGNNLNTSIDKINKIMADLKVQNDNLEKQKGDLETQKQDLQNQQRNIAIMQQQKQAALDQISYKKAQAQSSLNKLSAESDNVSSEIYALRRSKGGFSTGGTGGYPWASADTDGVDPYGFYYRQCTSFAAWYFNEVEGKYFISWRRMGVNRSSNAGDWPDLARHQGYSVSSTPRAGAIVSWPAGGLNAYGHVAIVKSVNSNGTFNLAEYNWVPYSYSERSNVSVGNASFIY